MKHGITPGSSEPLGVTPTNDGVNVAVFSAHASAIEFCLFDAQGDAEIERIPLAKHSGDIFHAHVADVRPGARYGLRAHGPYAPREGHRFNPAKLLVDPYALQLDRPFALHRAVFGFAGADPNSADHRDDADSASLVPKAVVTDRTDLVTKSTAVRIAWPDTVIYELHVRGYTKQHPAIPESIRGTFAALGHPAAIAHLLELGVTTVELMPAAAWIDERHLPPLGLSNYWGYNPLALLAPDPRLAPGGWPEVRGAVDALHAAGLEVILDIVLNHSGESDELGPTLAFRGLDNASYYRLVRGEPQRYIDDMGCGNCLALDRVPVVRLALDALRTWMQLGGVDGFRFDLATALGRRDNGFDPAAPLFAAIEQDPLLGTAKLIAEPWDIGPGGYQTGSFPAQFAEWNDRFRDDVRRYWRSDAGLRGALATRIAGSSDLFARKQHPSHGVNFITAHDGFTLADLVSHAHKHNEANGEQNRDGTEANFSWNHGVEGASDDPAIRSARSRDQRNLLATLIFARGTPMLAMGAELGAIQGGNNNAYAQDNAGSWVDWGHADRELTDFTRALLAARRAHPALRSNRFLDGMPFDESGIPDIEWRSASATLASAADWEQSGDATLVAVFCAANDGQPNDRVAFVVHRGEDATALELPEPRDGFIWRRVVDTAESSAAAADDTEGKVHIAARSVTLFAEAAEVASPTGLIVRRGVDTKVLDHLATTAGIAPDWWDVAGNHHAVSANTKRALLAAMDLPGATTSQARESLNRLAQANERRLLPAAQVVRDGTAASMRVAQPRNVAMPRGGVSIRNEADEVVASFAADCEAARSTRDALGLEVQISTLPLPPLNVGRYIVCFDDAPETSCRLTIAPSRCYRPAALDGESRGGGRHFGVSVQAYSLRRARDGGIGDFSALGDFATAAAGRGAATVGINPLHMLFPHERERASPYHPSDRRFLDPIYLDLDALHDLPGYPDTASAQPGSIALFTETIIDYPAVWQLKSVFLEMLFAAFERIARAQPDNIFAAEFERFIVDGGHLLRDFARFQAIADRLPAMPWQRWPGALRDATSGAVEMFAAANTQRVRYAMFLQWLCDRQLAVAAARARNAGLWLGLYRDVAVGAAPDGAESWANAAQLAHGVSIGAPPDPLGPAGQVWNLPPPNPQAWRQSDFVPFREAIAANMHHAGALRIDHVMGLSRLFWVPQGGSAVDGAYVGYPLDDLVGQLALESQRARCLIVGEDLGTVPDGLRTSLANADILSYRVMLLERDGLGFKSPMSYAPNAVACAGTHDLPPLAGWWQGADIHERESLRLISGDESTQHLSTRREEKRLLLEALARDGIILPIDLDAPLDAETMAALHAWLARAPSALLLAQAEDLVGETIGQNLPGTDRERPNWRRRFALTAEELFASENAQRIVHALRQHDN